MDIFVEFGVLYLPSQQKRNHNGDESDAVNGHVCQMKKNCVSRVITTLC